LKIQDGGSRHLENHKKSRYLGNGLTDLYEIWYADAKWVSYPLRSLKNVNFTNPRWRTAAILKTVTSSYLCNLLTDFDKIWHGDARWSPEPNVKFKFLIFDNLIWQIAAI